MTRRLPIYLLLDCSESMAGKPLSDLETGVGRLLKALTRNPYAIETAFISVITFAAKARQLFPLTEVPLVRPPALSIRPGTCLGAALDLLREAIGREVAKTTAEEKGDFKPLVFILTDGYPTDDWEGPLRRLKAAKPSLATIYAIGCGEEEDIDFETLSQIADVCIHTLSTSSDDLARLFIWLSASVQSQSVSPEGRISLEKVPLEKGMELIDTERPPRFEGRNRWFYLHAKCRQNGKPYLKRFRRSGEGQAYRYQDAVELPADFFSDGTAKSPPIDASLLRGTPACPGCGSTLTARCPDCGAMFCLDQKAVKSGASCPSCEADLSFTIGGGGRRSIEGSMG
jgi:uncharacterized protein YegL